MASIKSPRTPLWSHLAQTLAGDILSGRRPVGSLLPTEAQLMNDYDMSRHTVRTALAELVHLGLVRRSPRRGTIVTCDGRGAEFTATLMPADASKRTLLSIRRLICDEDTSARTGFALLTPLITLTMLTKGPDGRTVARTELWVRDAARDLIPYLTPQSPHSVLALLEEHAGVRCRSMRQCAEATALDEECSKLFDVPEGSPALVVTRTYLDRRPVPLIHVVETRPAGVRACKTVFLRSTVARTTEHEDPLASELIPTD